MSEEQSSRQPVVLDIADDSDPLLRQVSVPVPLEEVPSEAFQNTIQDMIATMYSANGIGLAAPQVRILKRIMVFYLPAQRDDVNGTGVPLTVLINPEMEVLDSSSLLDFEGCLSVPGMRGKVARHRRIKYSGFNEKGERLEREAEGWHARLFQHEFDHLNGILYPDLMAKEDHLMTLEEWKQLTGK